MLKNKIQSINIFFKTSFKLSLYPMWSNSRKKSTLRRTVLSIFRHKTKLQRNVKKCKKRLFNAPNSHTSFHLTVQHRVREIPPFAWLSRTIKKIRKKHAFDISLWICDIFQKGGYPGTQGQNGWTRYAAYVPICITDRLSYQGKLSNFSVLQMPMPKFAKAKRNVSTKE